MAKPLYLHLGFHKTATTYLQLMINLNRGGVLRDFHVVNRFGHETRPLKIAMALYGLRGTPATRDAAVAECEKIAAQFEASGKQKLLLSDEAVIGPILRQLGETGLYTTLEQKMTLLIECFSAYDLHFLFYVREVGPWLRSLYNQAVKQVRFAGSFDEFVNGVDIKDIWGGLHKRISAAAQGRQIQFFSYQDEKDSPLGTGDSLFKYIGITDDERGKMLRPPDMVNASWPQAALDVMRYLNASPIDKRTLAIVRDIVKQELLLFK